MLIIGILSAVALPQYTKAVEKARLTEVLTNLKYAQDQMKIRYMECGEECMGNAKDYLELSGGEWGHVADGSFVPDSTSYTTKHFTYYFDRELSAYPKKGDYDITFGGNWETIIEGTTRRCYAPTDSAYKFCKSLEGQGFAVKDDR